MEFGAATLHGVGHDHHVEQVGSPPADDVLMEAAHEVRCGGAEDVVTPDDVNVDGRARRDGVPPRGMIGHPR